MTLLELAERCERAEGPDRELDDAIADALFTERQHHCLKGLSDEAGGMWMYRYPNGSIGSALRFTASLDAAMTLVPDEFDRPSAFTVQRSRNFGCSAVVWTNSEFNRYVNGKGKSPALALCAAALRARALSDSPAREIGGE